MFHQKQSRSKSIEFTMADEVKLLGVGASPFSRRIEVALKLKGISYEYIEQDLSNKSSLLLKSNPIHKKVPVLIHNGKPIVESLVILEYIDEIWKENPILPEDPYERATARFWAKFMDEKSRSKSIKFTMADEVKLLGAWASVFSRRIEIALKLKGIPYECIEQDLSNKSPLLSESNPVHKKVPVLIHNSKPIVESLVILEYIDETWKRNPILPADPYERATARFWAKFIDEKLLLAAINAARGIDKEKSVEETLECLKILEGELKGNKFFGGEEIGFVDIVGNFVAFWIKIIEQVSELELLTVEKFPDLFKWSERYVEVPIIKETLPPKEKTVALYKSYVQATK